MDQNLPGVPSGDVGRDSTDLAGRSSILVRAGQLGGAGLQIGVPAEPSTVSGVDVHDDVVQVQVRQGVGDALAVARGRVLAGGEVAVSHQVGKGVGLNDEGEGRVRVGFDDIDDGCETGLE